MNQALPGIYRTQLSFEQGFTRIPNTWLRDPNLGFRAKGLLAYLLSHEVGYTITIGQIERETGDGRHAIRTAIDELVDAGYLRTERTHDERGWNAGLAWFLQDPNPKSENPTLENPTLENHPALEENLFKKNTLKELNVHFQEFWSIFPRKQGKGKAREAFLKALDVVDVETLLKGARRYADDPNRVDAFTTMPATWLNQERWDDEPLPERVLSAEERKQLERDELAARRAREQALREEQHAREKAEREAFEREKAENPVPKCEHGRVLYLCRVCSPVS